MNSKQFTESTTSVSIATVSAPVGKTNSRVGKGIYPEKKTKGTKPGTGQRKVQDVIFPC